MDPDETAKVTSLQEKMSQAAKESTQVLQPTETTQITKTTTKATTTAAEPAKTAQTTKATRKAPKATEKTQAVKEPAQTIRPTEITVKETTIQAPTETEQPAKGKYIGNKNSKKFHLPSCRTLPAEKNRVYFDTREQAINKGFEPCKNCRP